MASPIVLHKPRNVVAVGVGNQQRLSGLGTAQTNCEEQVVVINSTIKVAIEVRKVFDHFDPAGLEDPQIKISIDSLNLSTKVQRVISANHGKRVAELQPPLFCPLWYAK